MEREAAERAERAARAAAARRAERAGRVLDHRQLADSASSGAGRPKRCTASTAFVLGVTRRARVGRIHVHRHRVDVDEHGRRAAERDDVAGRRERVGGHEHLVARPEPEREHRDVQRRRARRHGDGVLDADARPRAAPRTRSTFGAHRQLPGLEHLADLGELGLADVGRGEADYWRQRRLARAIPRDRPLEAVVELDLRVEADVLARLLDVRDAQLDVDVLERREDDLAGAAGEPLDALREVEDRHRAARVADVVALPDRIRMLEAEAHALDHVVDEAPGADLRAVAAHGEVVAAERRLDERADRAAADLARARRR